jgi:hypothetical protein
LKFLDTDSAIDLASIIHGGEKSLVVHLHPAFFSFMVKDVSNGEMLTHRCKLSDSKAHQISPTALDVWLKENQNIFNLPFQSVKVAVNALSFQLLDNIQLANPKSFALLNDFSELTHQLQVDEIQPDLLVHYAVNKKIAKILKAHFDKDAICFGDTGILNATAQNNDENIVIAQLLEHELTIVVRKNKQVFFFNKFTVQSAEDVLYYILSVYQSSELEPNEHQLYLTGLIETASPQYELLFNYVRNISLTSGFQPETVKHTMPSPHYFFNLLNI